MEKRISFFEFQSAKSIAKVSAQPMAKREKAKEKVKKAQEEMLFWDKQIQALEVGIKELTGFRVEQLVKKVVETSVDANGKETKTTKYVPTDLVTFDESTRQYIIHIPGEEDTNVAEPNVAETIVPPTTEDGFGSDFDEDKETVASNDFDPLDMNVF